MMSGAEFASINVVPIAVHEAKRYKAIETKLKNFCTDSMDKDLDMVPIAYIAAVYGWEDETWITERT